MSTKAKAAKTVKQFSKEALDAWKRDQLDPDNWLRIPEFGVQPADVGFKSFAFPIVTPEAHDDPVDTAMRDMVRIVRRLARAEFRSLEELKAISLETFDLLTPFLMMSAPEGESLLQSGKTPEVTARQAMAMRYINAMQAFDYAQHRIYYKPHLIDCERRANWFARGASHVLDLVTGKPYERNLAALARQRDGARAGGKASGKSRTSVLPEVNQLRRERDSLINGGWDKRDVAARLAQQYGCTSSYVRKKLATKRD